MFLRYSTVIQNIEEDSHKKHRNINIFNPLARQKAKEIYDRTMYDEEDFEEHTFNKMPQDVQIIMEGAANKAKIYNLMGLTRDQYLKFGDVYRFLASHGFVR